MSVSRTVGSKQIRSQQHLGITFEEPDLLSNALAMRIILLSLALCTALSTSFPVPHAGSRALSTRQTSSSTSAGSNNGGNGLLGFLGLGGGGSSAAAAGGNSSAASSSQCGEFSPRERSGFNILGWN
jgi:hypothetical protein